MPANQTSDFSANGGAILAGANNGFTPTRWGESREGFIGSVFSPLDPDSVVNPLVW
jgi:hypothetical protein